MKEREKEMGGEREECVGETGKLYVYRVRGTIESSKNRMRGLFISKRALIHMHLISIFSL